MALSGAGLAAGHWGHAGQALAGHIMGSGACGACAQAVSRMAATHVNGIRIMWIVLIEIVFALALLVLIVWWTWPKKRPESVENKSGKRGDDQ
jgi:hypothetical protein